MDLILIKTRMGCLPCGLPDELSFGGGSDKQALYISYKDLLQLMVGFSKK